MTAPDIREVPDLDPDPLDGTVERISWTITVPPGSTLNLPDWTWQRSTATSQDSRSREAAPSRRRLVIIAAASFVTGLLLGAAVARVVGL